MTTKKESKSTDKSIDPRLSRNEDLKSQKWDIHLWNEGDNYKFPFITIDNWYTPKEEELVWRELDYYVMRPKERYGIADSAEAGVARHPDGTPKSNAFRFHMWSYYTQRAHHHGFSHILEFMYKQRHPIFKNIVRKGMPEWHETYMNTNNDSTFVGYFEDGHKYDNHVDQMQFTCLIWLSKQPQAFTGGDLKIHNSNTIIEFKNNRMIFFPCYYRHEVLPVNMKKKSKDLGLGRFCITHFYNWINPS